MCKYIVLDIETTSFTSSFGEIIEIAAFKVENGFIIDEFVTLLKPETKVSKKITELTSITNEMLENSQHIKDVINDFRVFVDNLPIVGHNVKFDWDKYLLVYFNKYGLFPNNETIDTLKLFRTLTGRKKDCKLSDVADCYKFISKPTHRALNDTLTTYNAFKRISSELSDFKLPLCSDRKAGNYYKNYNIKSVNYWTMGSGKSLKARLYIKLYVENLYFEVYLDVLNNKWQMNESVKHKLIKDINFNILENTAIEFLNLSSKDDLLNYKN